MMNIVVEAREFPPALNEVLVTDRLIIRAATVNDELPTWKFRQIAAVNEWLTGTPDTADDYHTLFSDPERLARTVIVQPEARRCARLGVVAGQWGHQVSVSVAGSH